MSVRSAALVLTSVLLLGGVPVAAQPAASTADLIAGLLPEVVNLATRAYKKTPAVPGNIASQPSIAEKKSAGTGFIVDATGVIVTNRHVVADADEITVSLEDGTQLRASVLAAAVHSDIALLKVDADRPLPTVRFGDSDAMRPGDPVLVVGNPFGLAGTVTRGIVSALDRTSAESQSDSFMQIDAPLNQGNSGAPVFNTEGQVIAVGTALFSPGNDTGSVGLGLAIPANDVVSVINRLWVDGHDGIGWIGARVQALNADIAAALGRSTTTGSIVLAVRDDGPAARAGLSAGDVILKVGNDDADAPRILNRRIAESPVGGTIMLTVWRGGALHEVPVTVGELPLDAIGAKVAKPDDQGPIRLPARVTRDDLGLVLGPVTDEIARRLGLGSASRQGVAVSHVVAHSVAADHGVTAGSMLLSVDRTPVAAQAEVQRCIDAARGERRDFVLLLVQDQSGLRWVSLPLGNRGDGVVP